MLSLRHILVITIFCFGFVDQGLSKNYPLHKACEDNDIEQVKILVEKNKNINEKNKNNDTPLHIACKEQKEEISKYLIDKGANLNEKNKSENTPLHIACEEQNEEISKYLIDKGANLNEKNKSGNTPLHIACNVTKNKMLNTIEYLVKKGAKINEKNKAKDTPFRLAWEKNNQKVIKFLLENGANIDEKQNSKKSLLLSACEKGFFDIIALLISKGVNISKKNKNGDTPLHFLCNNGRRDEAKLLLEKGANIHEKNNTGNTPLHSACNHNDNGKMIKFLIENGAKIDEKNNAGNTPLHIVCNSHQLDEAKLLLENGAKIDEKNNDGNTPLHIACNTPNSFPSVTFLIEHGANIHEKNNAGLTPLFFAFEGMAKDTFNYLIEKGADINEKDTNGNTFLHTACADNNYFRFDNVKFLVEKGIKINEKNNAGKLPIHVACEKCDKNKVEYLVQNGADIKTKDPVEGSLLFWALKQEFNDLVALLLQKGAEIDIDEKDNNGISEVFFAIKNNSKKFVDELINKNIQINANEKNESGYTLLHYACMHNNFNLVDFLLKQNANVKAMNNNGDTPIDLAVKNYEGNIEIIKLLVKNGANIKETYKDRGKLFTFALEQNDTNIYNFLASSFHNLDADENDRIKLLNLACTHGNLEIVKYLVENYPTIINDEYDGTLPIVTAIKENRHEIVSLLLKQGVYAKGKDKYGTPLIFAALEKNSTELMKLFIENGANVNEKDTNGTPLIFAALKKDNIDIVKFLIENGANANEKDKYGNALICAALEKDNIDIVKFLIEKGANVNEKDTDGDTLLHRACKNNNLNMVKVLIDKFANINIWNRQYESPSDLTSQNDIKEFLKKYKETKIEKIQQKANEISNEKSENILPEDALKLKLKACAAYFDLFEEECLNHNLFELVQDLGEFFENKMQDVQIKQKIECFFKKIFNKNFESDVAIQNFAIVLCWGYMHQFDETVGTYYDRLKDSYEIYQIGKLQSYKVPEKRNLAQEPQKEFFEKNILSLITKIEKFKTTIVRTFFLARSYKARQIGEVKMEPQLLEKLVPYDDENPKEKINFAATYGKTRTIAQEIEKTYTYVSQLDTKTIYTAGIPKFFFDGTSFVDAGGGPRIVSDLLIRIFSSGNLSRPYKKRCLPYIEQKPKFFENVMNNDMERLFYIWGKMFLVNTINSVPMSLSYSPIFYAHLFKEIPLNLEYKNDKEKDLNSYLFYVIETIGIANFAVYCDNVFGKNGFRLLYGMCIGASPSNVIDKRNLDFLTITGNIINFIDVISKFMTEKKVKVALLQLKTKTLKPSRDAYDTIKKEFSMAPQLQMTQAVKNLGNDSFEKFKEQLSKIMNNIYKECCSTQIGLLFVLACSLCKSLEELSPDDKKMFENIVVQFSKKATSIDEKLKYDFMNRFFKTIMPDGYETAMTNIMKGFYESAYTLEKDQQKQEDFLNTTNDIQLLFTNKLLTEQQTTMDNKIFSQLPDEYALMRYSHFFMEWLSPYAYSEILFSFKIDVDTLKKSITYSNNCTNANNFVEVFKDAINTFFENNRITKKEEEDPTKEKTVKEKTEKLATFISYISGSSATKNTLIFEFSDEEDKNGNFSIATLLNPNTQVDDVYTTPSKAHTCFLSVTVYLGRLVRNIWMRTNKKLSFDDIINPKQENKKEIIEKIIEEIEGGFKKGGYES